MTKAQQQQRSIAAKALREFSADLPFETSCDVWLEAIQQHPGFLPAIFMDACNRGSRLADEADRQQRRAAA